MKSAVHPFWLNAALRPKKMKFIRRGKVRNKSCWKLKVTARNFYYFYEI